MSDPIASRLLNFNPAGPQEGGGAAAFKVGYQAPQNARNYGRHAPRFGTSISSPLSKSWLFEVVEKESGVVRESFTLIMPPQSLSIKEPQRVSITKTFGNAFVDDYGPDNLQITLKGISGTAHAFPTFSTTGKSSAFTDIAAAVSGATQASQNTKGYTGKNAFYTFRNRIMRYKDHEGWDKNELRVYDLADEQVYRCILLDFTLDRDSGSPLRYPFTISLFVFDKPDKLRVKRGRVINISKDPIRALDAADSFLDKVQSAYQDVQEVLNQVALLKAKTLELRTRYNNFLSQTTKIITSPLDLAKNFIESAFSAIGVLLDTYNAGKFTFERYTGANELIRGTLIQALKTYGFQISQGWQRNNVVEIETDAGIDASDPSSVSRAVALSQYTYAGLQVYTVRGDDTLQQIARNELGDDTLWPNIAAINSGISSNDDLVPGEEIFLPVQIDPGTGVSKEQFILTEDVARDPYGTDIRLDEFGNIVIQENSDFALVSGISNVKQAIDLRLNTPAGSIIKQTAFGITAQAGLAGTDLAIKYLKIAIRSTLTQDPRIGSVENMVVSVEKDALQIGMTINVIGAEESLPVTVQA